MDKADLIFVKVWNLKLIFWLELGKQNIFVRGEMCWNYVNKVFYVENKINYTYLFI